MDIKPSTSHITNEYEMYNVQFTMHSAQNTGVREPKTFFVYLKRTSGNVKKEKDDDDTLSQSTMI